MQESVVTTARIRSSVDWTDMITGNISLSRFWNFRNLAGTVSAW